MEQHQPVGQIKSDIPVCVQKIQINLRQNKRNIKIQICSLKIHKKKKLKKT